MNKKRLHTDDQFLQAFEYVSGDLNEQDTEAFELQMLEDDSLCDAVAEVTRLTSLVAACATGDISARPRMQVVSAGNPAARSRPGTFAAVTAVCCCLTLVVLLAGLPDLNLSTSVVQTADGSVGGQTEAELILDAWVDVGNSQIIADAEPAEVYSSDLDVPDWMLAAVTLEEFEQRDDSDMPVEGLMPDDTEVF